MSSNISFGDLNGDGIVTNQDVYLLLRAVASGDLSADLNNDGLVDQADASIMYTNLGKSLDDGVFLLGGDGDDIAIGGNGNDIIVTGGGDDTILSGDGDDIVVGGAGNDYIDAGSGANIIVGGGGNDTFVLSFADPNISSNTYRADTIKDFGTGKDKLQIDDDAITVVQYMINQTINSLGEFTSLFVSTTSGSADYLYSYAMLEGVDSFIKGYANVVNIMHGGIYGDNMKGSNLDDRLNGNGGDDVINGKGGDDVLTGGDGNDNLKGDKGDDTLDGGSGDDVLSGGKGNNEVSSGAGNDIMIAKGGHNTFIFTNDDFYDDDLGDVIRGFGKDDSIDLTDLGDLYFAASDGADGITLNIVVNTHNAPVSPNWIHHSVLFEGTHDLDLVESSIIY